MSSITFIGQSASGKTSALCLLHFTAIDYGPELGIRSYMPKILSPDYDFYDDAYRLVLRGEEVKPTDPNKKDLKIELYLNFEGWLHGKMIKLVFADMAGAISASLMRVFPELVGKVPDEIIRELSIRGIKPDDARYLIRSILESKGVILVADSTKIGGSENPDSQLSYYLNNLLLYAERNRKMHKGIGLLITKFDKWFYLYGDSPTSEVLISFVEDKMPQVWGIMRSLSREKGIHTEIFCSGLEEEKEKQDNKMFVVMQDAQGRFRVKYNVEQYKKMLLWIKETFK